MLVIKLHKVINHLLGHHGRSMLLYPADAEDIGLAKNLKPRISSGIQETSF